MLERRRSLDAPSVGTTLTRLPRSPWLWLALGCSLGSLATFSVNLFFYRKPQARPHPGPVPRVSVLIPARNEEASIVAAVQSVLASTGVDLELLVLDDASTDQTAALVQALHKRDARVTLHAAPPLPPGWNGKQHACAMLAGLAQHEALCFLDADVRLAPGLLSALLSELDHGKLDLASGFPREETDTWLEKLLLPLIHFVLLCYLPLPLSRSQPSKPSLAASCGQLMLVRKHAYQASGGHAAIRATMHDGLLLPHLLREHGFATGIFDLTHLARCRMYRNAGEVWRGLGKNATEGMAAPARIVPFSVMLFFGQVLPAGWLVVALARRGPLLWPGVAAGAGYLVRALAVWRFQQNLFGALLHPVAISLLLTLQWWSLARKWMGRQIVRKQRPYDVG